VRPEGIQLQSSSKDREVDHGEESKGEKEIREEEKGRTGAQEKEAGEGGEEKIGTEEKSQEGRTEAQGAGQKAGRAKARADDGSTGPGS
jgi:hypothetical protein